MSVLQVSERIIKRDFITLEEIDNKEISHNESDLYYKNDLVYKIFKQKYRLDKEKNIYYIYKKNFPYANNIIDKLYQGDKLIGVTNNYLNNLITMKTYMNNLDLYDIKTIMSYIIEFYEITLKYNLVYWDNHLNNIGISNGNLYILDIDSLELKQREENVYFALNGLLTLFYEMYYKIPLRNEYNNYKEIIYNISECSNYTKYILTLNEIKNIINNSSIDNLESKRKFLDLKKI